MTLAVLVPVLDRPHRVKPLLDAFEAATPAHDVFMIADPDDHDEIEAIWEDGRAHLMLVDGGYAKKINYAVAYTTHSVVLLAADDLAPQSGWLEVAQRLMRPPVGCVGINDDISRPHRPQHATHFLMTREYAELGTIDGQSGPLHEYAAWFTDDELIATATKRGMYAYARDSHVTHLHPMNGTAPDDATYAKGRDGRMQDGQTFASRIHLWS